MKKFERDCVDCGRPEHCSSCKLNGYSEHYYCDKCHAEERLYHYEDEELCIDCIAEKLEVVEGSDY